MARAKMKAVLYHGPGKLEVTEVAVPSIGRGELLVKVKAALTCGTDVKTFKRGHHLLIPPTLFGHEFAGDIVRGGERRRDVKHFSEGVRVVAANSAPCNACFFCKRGKHNLCEDILFNWGAFAEYIRLPARIVQQNVHHIPPGLSYEEAALVEPLSCVVLGSEAADIQSGDTVVIAGGTGPIGLMHLQLAINRGAGEVIVIGLKDERWTVAKELGASHLINAEGEDPVARVRELTEGRGVDVVIESAGLPQVWEMALKLVRKGGRLVLFGGLPRGTTVSFDAARLHYDALTIKGVFHHTPRTVEQALSLLTSGAVKAKPLISTRLPLEKLEEGLKMMMEGQAIKVAILPEGGLEEEQEEDEKMELAGVEPATS
ncbi:zinc-binding dehydrogenase [candidate division NPL-UPA2 bacterium]|nr:zinc-binding dehydrogenase [candidate division NPL-UPA2 bacterium]